MYHKMLIAIDDSEASRHALEQALVLAKTEDCRVTVATVIPAYDGDLRLLGDKGVLKAMRTPYEQALQAAHNRAQEEQLEIDAHLLEGDPVEEILALSERIGANIVVLGKRGNYYSDLVPIGSVASKIARLSAVDVLLIPPDKPLRLHALLVPFDGSRHAQHAAHKGMKLAARYGSIFYLATIYELPLVGFEQDPGLDKIFYDKAQKSQEKILHTDTAKELRQLRPLIRQGAPVHGVLKELIVKEDIGLLIMSHAGRGNLHHLILGKVTERLIGCGVAPVLLIKTHVEK